MLYYRLLTDQIAQANNALIFPGLGLGTIVSRARTVSDGMLAGAEAVAGLTDRSVAGGSLLPPIENLRALSAAVASAVVTTAIQEGLAGVRLDDVEGHVQRAMWQPVYRPVVAA